MINTEYMFLSKFGKGIFSGLYNKTNNLSYDYLFEKSKNVLAASTESGVLKILSKIFEVNNE